MQRLNQLNLQFAAAKPASTPSKPKKGGNFTDAWAYLGMDEYISAEARTIRDKCRAFAERYNPDVSCCRALLSFTFSLIY